MEVANGAICGFLDPDDFITNDALEQMVKGHVNYPDASLVYSTHYLCNADLSVQEINKAVGPIPKYKSYFTDKTFGVSHFAVFKVALYKLTDGINPDLKRAVDQDMYYKLEEVGGFRYIDLPLYFYRRHERGISTASNALKAKYWHAVVATATWKRRNKSGFKHNISHKDIKKYWNDYYFWKAEQKAYQGEFCKTIYLVVNAIKYGKTNIVQKLKLIPFSLLKKFKNAH